jgi:hypothetical protein
MQLGAPVTVGVVALIDAHKCIEQMLLYQAAAVMPEPVVLFSLNCSGTGYKTRSGSVFKRRFFNQ